MEFAISPITGVPIYQQIAEQIRSAIARGKLRADERLPSVRELSQILVVNPNTVARSYTELEREGVLYTRPGLGVFVASTPAPLSKKSRRERLIPIINQLLVEAVSVGCSSDELASLVAERSSAFRWNSPTTVQPATSGRKG